MSSLQKWRRALFLVKLGKVTKKICHWIISKIDLCGKSKTLIQKSLFHLFHSTMADWQRELDTYLAHIERHTTNSLLRIKEVFNESGRNLDRKFRKHFVNVTRNRWVFHDVYCSMSTFFCNKETLPKVFSYS